MPVVLDKYPGDAEVRDSDLIARISAIRWRAANRVWCRYELVPDDRLRPAARHENQCAR
jgi:hypothetical protein